MPLLDSPNRGYADWQRINNFDSGPLYQSPANPQNTFESTPLLDVSRYEYLGGNDGGLNVDVIVSLVWYADAGQNVLAGQRQFLLTSLGISPAQYRLPNLGPFVTVQWRSLGAAAFNHHAVLIGTNRYNPLEFIPHEPVLIDRQNVNLNSGVVSTFYPTDYYAGPLNVSYYSSVTQFAPTLQYLSSNDTWDDGPTLPSPAAGAWAMGTIVTPPGAWRMNVEQTSGAAGVYYLSAIPTVTGSS